MPPLGLSLPLSLWLWLLPACLPASSGGWASLLLALLCYSLSPLFSESASSALDEHFLKESSLSLSLFFFSLWLSHGLGCYLTLAPSDCLQGIQAWSVP